MKLKGIVVVEREEVLTFDIGELTEHWTEEEREALLDEGHEEHDDAREGLLDTALGEVNKALDRDGDVYIASMKIRAA